MKKGIKHNMFLVFKVFVLLFSVGLLVVSCVVFNDAYNLHKTLTVMKKPVLEMAVDFSVPGEFSGKLGQVNNYFHGLNIELEIKTPETDGNAIEGFMDGVAGDITVLVDSKEIVESYSFSADDFMFNQYTSATDGFANIRLINGIKEFSSEDSQLDIVIEKGASKLKGVSQRLIVKYDLCGMESLALIFSCVVGGLSLLISLAVGIPVARSIFRKKQDTVISEEPSGNS